MTTSAVTVALLCAVPTTAHASPFSPGAAPPGRNQLSGVTRYDARTDVSGQEQAARSYRAARMSASAGVQALQTELGTQGVIDIDPATTTPRVVAKLDGFLTAPSPRSPVAVALDYVAAHPSTFRLSATDLHGLTLARDYVDIAGVSHLSWVQTIGGVPLFDNGLKANVAKNGALINVEGSPVSGLRAPAAAAALTGVQAISRAKASIGSRSIAPTTDDTAKPVLFATSGGTRAAYQVVAMSLSRPALFVVDGVSGRVLYRESLTADEKAPSPDETALVYDNYPGAASGGTAHPVDLTAQGWLPAGATRLNGNNVHTYTDVDDNNTNGRTEEVPPAADGTYVYPLQRITSVGTEPCDAYVCTWRPNTPYSWQLNRAQTSTQNFYYINKYHDHLQAAPIGFTEAAGNFQLVNRTGLGKGGDPVLDEPLDGADTANGLPDGNHIDNANFGTPPDGQSPRMQMYLWHEPGASYPNEDPFLAVSGADESDIVYHEYTHGLSHRLVVDANNDPALDSQQGGSMGEAWSDWYAFDFLADQGYVTDTAAPGEVALGGYVSAIKNLIRTEPMDCPVGASKTRCPGTPGAGSGGYTYGDFGKIIGVPEVHADGEIWAQTLWDLRTAVGSGLAESLVTRGMELSPTYPSYLDMRNAIIQADVADYAGAHVAELWRIFAHRGMGFFAGTITGDDTSPVESFALPPAPGSPTAQVTGTVVDSATGAPVVGAVVAFGGHDSGFPGSYSAITSAKGRYTIRGVLYGKYPDVYAAGAGYNPQVRTVAVRAPVVTESFSLVRDWAAASGGASIASTNGDEYANFGCGAAAMIDQSLGVGWSADLPAKGTGKYATVELPAAVDISSLQIDPTGTCGDEPSASTAAYTVETSTDGTTFATAASGTFTPADTGHLVTVPLATGTGTAVRYVRYTMLSTQVAQLGGSCPGPYSGCLYIDSRELEVFGTPAG